MSRTNIDKWACADVMRRYRLSTRRAAVNFALRTIAAEPLSLDEACSLRGVGWHGDLETTRSGHPPWSFPCDPPTTRMPPPSIDATGGRAQRST